MSKDLIFGSGVSAHKDFEGTLEVCCAALNHGIRWFDTAPSYHTEEIVSRAVAVSAKRLGLQREEYFIQTKIDPIQMYNGQIVEYFKDKLNRMKLEYVDALLIHWPVWEYFSSAWDSLQELKDKKLTHRIGICNLRISHLGQLCESGIIPDIVQIERHPLNTFEQEARFCNEKGIVLQDYSPLCKMHPRIKNNPQIQKIASKYNRNIGQIVLRWHLDTGGIPVFTSTKPERIREYTEIDDFSLTPSEIESVSALNCNHKLYLESLVCPGF